MLMTNKLTYAGLILIIAGMLAGTGCASRKTVKATDTEPKAFTIRVPWSFIILYYANHNDRKIVEFHSNRTMNIIPDPGKKVAYTYGIDEPDVVGEAFELFRSDSLSPVIELPAGSVKWLHITSCEMLLEGTKDITLYYDDIRELPVYIRAVIQLINRYLRKSESIL